MDSGGKIDPDRLDAHAAADIGASSGGSFPFESLQESFDPERFAQRQVSLKSLEKRLDVRFDALLHAADTLAGHDGAGVELTSPESIQPLR